MQFSQPQLRATGQTLFPRTKEKMAFGDMSQWPWPWGGLWSRGSSRNTQYLLPPSRIHWSLCVRRPTDDTVFLEQQGGLQGLTWHCWGHGLLCGVLVQRGPDLYTGQSSLPWCMTWGCILTWWSRPTVLNICCFSHPWSRQPHRETPAAPGSAQRATGGLASVALWTMCS